VMFLLVRGYRPRIVVALLALALTIQIVDTRNGWMGLRNSKMITPSAEWATPMRDPFWASAAAHYSKVRSLMPQNQSERWQVIADFAATHGLKTDAVYLGRMSAKALDQARQKTQRMLESGQYDADSLYILDDSVLADAAKSVNSEADLLTRVDDLVVLAPGWKRCSQCLSMPDEGRRMSWMALSHPGQVMTFNHTTRQLSSGWSPPENWGTWSAGQQAQVDLRVTPEARSIALEVMAFVLPQHPAQRVIVSLNGEQVLTTRLTQLQDNHLDIPIPAAIREQLVDNDRLTIELQLPDAISPEQLGLNDDSRVMGLGLRRLTVN
jgi:hypothetical protein